MISSEEKELVRRETDFVQLVSETVELRRRGSDLWGCCPFHHEKTPSFHVSGQTGLWHCFGCGTGGDVFDYVMRRENLDFQDSVRYLADRIGIELHETEGGPRGPRRNRLVECCTAAEAHYQRMLMRGRASGPAAARSYLAGRGFGSAICRTWGLGYAPGRGSLVRHLREQGFTDQEIEAADLGVRRSSGLADRFYERVMFPIHDELGRTIGFGGRVLTDAKPKYLNTKENAIFHKRRNLFAFDRAKESIAAAGEAIVCEGYTDVIAMHEAGLTTTVAALGTSFSLEHAKTLARFASRIICLFDGDAAGQRAAERAIQFIDKVEADLRCVVLPDNLDPAEYLAAHGADAMRQTLARESRSLVTFVLDKRLEQVSPEDSSGIRDAKLAEIAQVVAPLKESVIFEDVVKQIAYRIGASEPYVANKIRMSKVRTYDEDDRSVPTHAKTWASAVPHSSAAPDQVPYEELEGAYVDDYLPAEAFEGQQQVPVAAQAAGLNPDERVQLTAERELLGLMAQDIDAVRDEGERIASLAWADERHEAMAWAMLATPLGTAPQDVVAAASAVVEGAPQILASARVATEDALGQEEKVQLVLNTCELYSTRRKIAVLRSRLRSGVEASSEAFVEATLLQRRAMELSELLRTRGRRVT